MGDFEKLKSISIDEIYQRTYISHQNIEDILSKNYANMTKFKALGFIGMIEKEFNLNLSELKNSVAAHFDEIEKELNRLKKLQEPPKKEIDKNVIKIVSILVLGLLVIVLIFSRTSYDLEQEQQIIIQSQDNSAQEITQTSSLVQEESSNETLNSDLLVQETTPDTKEEVQEIVPIVNEEKELEVKQELKHKVEEKQKMVDNISTQKQIVKSVKISPKHQIWVGVIYLDDYSKRDFLTTKPIELDTSREQLVLTGHGHISISVGDSMMEYNDENRQRFMYKDGEFKLINMEIFKQMNNGKNW